MKLSDLKQFSGNPRNLAYLTLPNVLTRKGLPSFYPSIQKPGRSFRVPTESRQGNASLANPVIFEPEKNAHLGRLRCSSHKNLKSGETRDES